MPLKLLPHKSWHVYSQENIARVKRDEAIAQQAQDDQQNRTMIADSEARIGRMKQETKKRKSRDSDRVGEKELERQLKGKKRDDGEREGVDTLDKGKGRESNDAMMTGGHLNFWAHLEASTPAELERQLNKAVKAKEPKESEIDALTKVYLAKKGEGEPKGWYASEDGKTERERKGGEEATLERAYRDGETKRLTDPLALMNSYLKRRDDVKSGNLSASTKRQPSSRDRYIEPSSSSRSGSRYDDTPRSERSRRDDDLEPVVEKLLGERRRRGGPIPRSSSTSTTASSTMPPPPSRSSSSTSTKVDPKLEAQRRVESERARTAALLAARRKQAALEARSASSSASSVSSMTPRSEFGSGMFNPEEVRAVRQEKERRGGAVGGWGERKERRDGRERESRDGWARRR